MPYWQTVLRLSAVAVFDKRVATDLAFAHYFAVTAPQQHSRGDWLQNYFGDPSDGVEAYLPHIIEIPIVNHHSTLLERAKKGS